MASGDLWLGLMIGLALGGAGMIFLALRRPPPLPPPLPVPVPVTIPPTAAVLPVAPNIVVERVTAPPELVKAPQTPPARPPDIAFAPAPLPPPPDKEDEPAPIEDGRAVMVTPVTLVWLRRGRPPERFGVRIDTVSRDCLVFGGETRRIDAIGIHPEQRLFHTLRLPQERLLSAHDAAGQPIGDIRRWLAGLADLPEVGPGALPGCTGQSP